MLWRWPTLDWMRGPVKCGLTTREIRGFKFSSVSTAQPPDEMVQTSNATACLSGVECGRTVLVADDNHGRKDARSLQSDANRGPFLNFDTGVHAGTVKPNLHETATKHHAYDRGA